jgi:hypothetical protein
VKDDREKMDLIVQSFGAHMEALQDSTKPAKKPLQTTTRSVPILPAYSLDYIVFPTGVEIDMDLDDFDGAQSILEEHVSRVWDNNNFADPNSLVDSRSSVGSLLPSRGLGARGMIHPSPDVSSSSFARFSAGISSTRRSFCGFGGSAVPPAQQQRSDWQDFNFVNPAHPHRQIHSTPKSKALAGSSSAHITSQSDSEMWSGIGGGGQNASFRHPNRVQRTSSEDSVDFTSRNHDQPCFSSQPNLSELIEARAGNYHHSTSQSRAAGHPSCSSLCSGPFHDHSVSTTAGSALFPDTRRSWSSHRSQLERSSSSTEPVVMMGQNQGDAQWMSSANCRHIQSFHGRSETSAVGNGTVLDLSSITNSRHSVIDVSSNEPPTSTTTVPPITGRHPPASSSSHSQGVTVVGFYLGDEEIPYRTTIASTNVTLGQFKQLVSKRGNYRYFFKKACDEFGSGVVLEEVFDDDEVLPLWEGKIIGRVERKL